MRILLVPNTTASMVWFRLPFLAQLAGAGHRVWVAAPEGWGIDQINATGAQFVPLHQTQGWSYGAEAGAKGSYANPLHDLTTVRALRRICRVVRPELVLSYTHKMTVLTSAAARAAGVPRVHGMVTGLGYANLGGSPKRELLKRAYHLSIKAAAALSDSIILLNPDNLDELVAGGIVSRSKAWWMDGEGVDTTRFDAPAPAWEHGAATFLLVARLVQHKGVAEFVTAATRLAAEFPEARFLVAGTGDPKHPDALDAATLQRWKTDGPAEFLGHVDDIPALMEQASVFVLPSYGTEGLPMSTMEAMAMRRPILTTHAPGNRETVEEGVNGFLVPQRDAEALTERMRRFLGDPTLGPRMVEASRERCIRRFDQRLVNAALLQHLGL